MKKILCVILLSAFSFATYAYDVKHKEPTKKTSKIKAEKKKPYPVTATLSCGITITFTSNCTGTVAECIPCWNEVIDAEEALKCPPPGN